MILLSRYPDKYNQLIKEAENKIVSFKLNLDKIKNIIFSLSYNNEKSGCENNCQLFCLIADCFLLNIQQETILKKLNNKEKEFSFICKSINDDVNKLTNKQCQTINTNASKHILPNSTIAQIHLLAVESYEKNRNISNVNDINKLKFSCNDILTSIINPIEKTFNLYKRFQKTFLMLESVKSISDINYIEKERNAIAQDLNDGKDFELNGISSKMFREIDFITKHFKLINDYNISSKLKGEDTKNKKLADNKKTDVTYHVDNTPLNMQISFTADFFKKISKEIKQEIKDFLNGTNIIYRNCLSQGESGIKFITPTHFEIIFNDGKKNKHIKGSATTENGVTTICFDYILDNKNTLSLHV